MQNQLSTVQNMTCPHFYDIQNGSVLGLGLIFAAFEGNRESTMASVSDASFFLVGTLKRESNMDSPSLLNRD